MSVHVAQLQNEKEIKMMVQKNNDHNFQYKWNKIMSMGLFLFYYCTCTYLLYFLRTLGFPYFGFTCIQV